MNNADKPSAPGSWLFFSEINKEQCNTGLTKREHFAAMAMQGMLASKFSGEFMTEINDDSYDMAHGLANNAIRYADALLKELNNEYI